MIRPRLRCCLLVVLLSTLALVGVRCWPREPLAARFDSSTAVLDRQGRLLRLTLASDAQYRLWTDLEEVSPQFVAALLLQEDRFFYWHPGVNPVALLRAAVRTWGGGGPSGGSTLSMQLARWLYGIDTRTVRGKLWQIVRALQLEACYSKHDLLEAHLNLASYGGNVQGVGAASLIYFDTAPRLLNLAQALTLVAIAPAPARRVPAGAEPAELRIARAHLWRRWQRVHPHAAAASESLSRGRGVRPLQYRRLRELPFLAPHFTTHLLATTPRTARGQQLHATLDVPLQRLLEGVLRDHVNGHADSGIRNAAALLVDHRDLAVRAMVGSADFRAAAICGQLNGTLARRPAASMLQPFAHALRSAAAQGIAEPLLADGSQMSMAQLAMLYATLANHGELAPLRYARDVAASVPLRLLSPHAAHAILASLRDTLDTPQPFAREAQHVRAAWHTGTSPDRRDSWAAGLFGPYVLVVWVGDFNGSGHPASARPAFAGMHGAAPLFFRIAGALAAADPLLVAPANDLPALAAARELPDDLYCRTHPPTQTTVWTQ